MTEGVEECIDTFLPDQDRYQKGTTGGESDGGVNVQETSIIPEKQVSGLRVTKERKLVLSLIIDCHVSRLPRVPEKPALDRGCIYDGARCVYFYSLKSKWINYGQL